MTVNLRGKMPASKRARHLKRSRSYLQRTKRHNKKATMSMLPNKCSRLRKSAGVVTGLAWTSMGGAVLYIETQPVGPVPSEVAEGEGSGGGRGSLRTTGQMGDVMKESSTIAHTYARTYLNALQPDNTYLERAPLHLHVPEGATPKDGPSAGVTMVTALLSLATATPPRADLAMTGELSLTGKVLPIGGVKEKTIAARRAGVVHVVFPKANEPDFAELPEMLKEGLTPYFADTYDDVYRVAFPDGTGGVADGAAAS